MAAPDRYDTMVQQIVRSIDEYHSQLEKKKCVLLRRVKGQTETHRDTGDSSGGRREGEIWELEPINDVVFHSNADKFAECIEEICLLEPGSHMGRRNPCVSSGRRGGMGDVSFPEGLLSTRTAGLCL